MSAFAPGPDEVVAIASRQAAGEERRTFILEQSPPETTDLPDLDGIRHESDLTEAMRRRGYRLTMVGGGAGGDELRRFYFRKR